MPERRSEKRLTRFAGKQCRIRHSKLSKRVDMSDCIFCKIIAGELPSHKVYETDSVLAFLDVAPVNAGHTLVVPKAHYGFIEDVSPADAAHLIEAVQKIGGAIKKG